MSESKSCNCTAIVIFLLISSICFACTIKIDANNLFIVKQDTDTVTGASTSSNLRFLCQTETLPQVVSALNALYKNEFTRTTIIHGSETAILRMATAKSNHDLIVLNAGATADSLVSQKLVDPKAAFQAGSLSLSIPKSANDAMRAEWFVEFCTSSKGLSILSRSK